MSGMSDYFYRMKSLSTASAHVNVFDFENDPSGKALSHCVRKRVTPSIRHDQNLFSS